MRERAGKAMAARMPTIAMTVISSSREKPERDALTGDLWLI
jgi:hypothetical protein